MRGPTGSTSTRWQGDGRRASYIDLDYTRSEEGDHPSTTDKPWFQHGGYDPEMSTPSRVARTEWRPWSKSPLRDQQLGDASCSCAPADEEPEDPREEDDQEPRVENTKELIIRLGRQRISDQENVGQERPTIPEVHPRRLRRKNGGKEMCEEFLYKVEKGTPINKAQSRANKYQPTLSGDRQRMTLWPRRTGERSSGG